MKIKQAVFYLLLKAYKVPITKVIAIGALKIQLLKGNCNAKVI